LTFKQVISSALQEQKFPHFLQYSP
jgi:hypothetical protein